MRAGVAIDILGFRKPRQRLGQLARAKLVGEHLAVLERQIDEELFDGQ